jgi:uncharacterized protein (TIGR03083 family)
MAEARTWVAALRDSHDRLIATVDKLTPEQLSGPSDCSEWTIAQVLSHLGSGAEIFNLMVDAGLGDGQAPGNETFPPIWDTWNAKGPKQQTDDFKTADADLIEKFEALSDKQIADFKISMFGMDLDAAGLLAMRLSEHALHSWDVTVVVDSGARVSEAATGLLIDGLESRVARAGKPVGGPIRVHIETSSPDRTFMLTVDETVSLVPGAEEEDGGAETANLQIPAEALLRLVAGRMDPDHTPAEVKADGVSLDSLRAVFPGF